MAVLYIYQWDIRLLQVQNTESCTLRLLANRTDIKMPTVLITEIGNLLLKKGAPFSPLQSTVYN